MTRRGGGGVVGVVSSLFVQACVPDFTLFNNRICYALLLGAAPSLVMECQLVREGPDHLTAPLLGSLVGTFLCAGRSRKQYLCVNPREGCCGDNTDMAQAAA